MLCQIINLLYQRNKKRKCGSSQGQHVFQASNGVWDRATQVVV